MPHPRPSCSPLALLLCALPAAAQQTLVVAAAGGTPYQTIQAAVGGRVSRQSRRDISRIRMCLNR